MDYEIYCDESCIESLFDKNAHNYAVIGGIWIPADCRAKIKTFIGQLKSKYGFMGEMKWNKVSPSSLCMYMELVDMFFSTYQIRFRAICMEASKIDNVAFNNGNGELGFYKFYFQLLQHWLLEGNKYSIFLDYKINGYRNRVNELAKILQYTSNATICQAQALPSNESALIQLADIFTGATAASFNGELNAESSKQKLCHRIESYLGHTIMSTGISEQKFNVFNINLRKGW